MKITETNRMGIKVSQNYESPTIEIFEIAVEKGFAQSGNDSPAAPTEPVNPSKSSRNNGPWG